MTIYYRKGTWYAGNYSEHDETVHVDGYEGIEQWVKEVSKESIFDGTFYAPHTRKDCSEEDRINSVKPSRWVIRVFGSKYSRDNETLYIHMVKNDSEEIVFTDGYYTCGEEFQTYKMLKIGDKLYKYSKESPHYNYASK